MTANDNKQFFNSLETVKLVNHMYIISYLPHQLVHAQFYEILDSEKSAAEMISKAIQDHQQQCCVIERTFLIPASAL